MYTVYMNRVPEVITAAVIVQYSEGEIYLTLTSTKDDEESQKWRLPSSPVFQSHTSLSSLSYQLKQSIGLKDEDITYREQLYTTESVQDLQTTVQICYLLMSRSAKWYKGEDQVGLFPIDRLPKLSKSDMAIVRYALDRLHAKTLYSSVIGFLLPTTFNLNDLQQAFETITRKSVDRRNFRKKILSLNVLKETQEPTSTKPARYSFKSTDLILFDTPFRSTTSRPKSSSKAS